MNIQEVAKRAGVSSATVSRTLNRIPTVDRRLAKRVWKAASELGYYPNTHARGLVLGRTRILGLIVSDITDPFFPEVIESFEDAAVEHNYEILLVSTQGNPERTEASVRRIIERRVDGVAVLTSGINEELLGQLQFRKLPLVLVDSDCPPPGTSNLKIDYGRGIRQAVEHLAALHHEKIAFITGPLTLRSALTRKNAFENVLRQIGMHVDPQLVIEGDHTMEGGMCAFGALIDKGLHPTAVMCSNDLSAIGVMREAYERGVSVPQELSVVGFDDVRIAQFIVPPLTSVRVSQAGMGRLAFNALFAELQREKLSRNCPEYLLTTDLVLRSSTALAPGRGKSPATQTRARRPPDDPGARVLTEERSNERRILPRKHGILEIDSGTGDEE
jgi:DNA-binding LacI/PurR family transcriptional regulator